MYNNIAGFSCNKKAEGGFVVVRDVPKRVEDFKWPKDGGLDDHLCFLIDARIFVQNQDVPEPCGEEPPYSQYSHARAEPVGGDLRKPAITDCCYYYGMADRYLVSVGIPDFTPCQPILNEDDEGNFLGLNNGLTYRNFMLSLQSVLDAYGIPVEGAKLGHDGHGRIQYVEYDVAPDDFEKGHLIVDT